MGPGERMVERRYENGSNSMRRNPDRGAGKVITRCPSCHLNQHDFMGATVGQIAESAHLTEALWDQRDVLAPMWMLN